jgi:hypothetical protein
MIPKKRTPVFGRVMLGSKIEQDDDSKKNRPALAALRSVIA